MRILMTTDTVGGVWTFTTTLTEQLLNRGHEVDLISFGRRPSPAQQSWADNLQSSPVISTGGEPGAERHPYFVPGAEPPSDNRPAFTYTPTEIPLEWMQNNENAFTAGQQTLLRQIQQHTPDVLLSSQFCFGAIETPVARVVVAHSDVLSWAMACRGKPLDPSPWFSRYITMVQAGLLQASAVAAPTFTMAKALVDHFVAPHGVEVIPNGAQVPATSTPPPRKLQAITAGRLWDEAKGLDTLRELRSPVPILVAGENTFDTAQTSDAWPNHLTSLGPLSQPDLHAQFRQSAFYLCSSRYEPFGLAPLEAALCGCALVCRDIPTLREVWQRNALFFTDEPSLARILQQLANNPVLLANYQQRALTGAQVFTPDRMTDSYLALFHSVLRRQEATHYAA